MATANFIDLVDEKTQTKLIRLFINVDQASPTMENDIGFTHNHQAELSYDLQDDLPTESCTVDLEKQWQKALSQPPALNHTYQDEHNKNNKHLVSVYQTQIEHTLVNIAKVEKLVERAEKTIIGTSETSPLIDHYQSLKDRYLVYLAKIQALQQQQFSKLNQ
ncbi:hypothetical protein ACFS25_09890 [Spirosoma flavum]|uniref:Uncharacterized protein n=2 Tax=Spirosoma flavum TaxID=2048557 RepID=A0ABW6AHH0_9BACT